MCVCVLLLLPVCYVHRVCVGAWLGRAWLGMLQCLLHCCWHGSADALFTADAVALLLDISCTLYLQKGA